ncbi:MAG: cyclic pyranopterin monophosphate synthase MoaC [Verrucomicrobiota bacterium]
MNENFSHLDETGSAKMVDVSKKPDMVREASAQAIFCCQSLTIKKLKDKALPKGDVLTVAKIAGIQAAKETSRIIPLCHPLPLSGMDIEFEIFEQSIRIGSKVRTTAKTGVEMEALTAVQVAALTLFDMCKAVDQNMSITDVRVITKTKANLA